jgi:hypothetical protein
MRKHPRTYSEIAADVIGWLTLFGAGIFALHLF